MDLYEQQIHRERYLLTLHQLAEGTTSGVSVEDVESYMGMEPSQLDKVASYLLGEGYIKQVTFTTVGLTHPGLKEVERLLSLPYEEIEGRVLWMINYLSGGSLSRLVLISALARRLVRDERELYPIVNDLDERKGLIRALNEAIVLLPAGKEALEESHRRQKSAPPMTQKAGDVYNTTIENLHGAAQFGSNNVQNVQINATNNPEFDDAIASLLQIIKSSALADDEVGELREEVAKLNRLALSKPKPDSLEKAKFRLDKAKLCFEGTKLMIQAAPHLHTAWEYLRLKFGG